jgi:hypothetical protein
MKTHGTKAGSINNSITIKDMTNVLIEKGSFKNIWIVYGQSPIPLACL